MVYVNIPINICIIIIPNIHIYRLYTHTYIPMIHWDSPDSRWPDPTILASAEASSTSEICITAGPFRAGTLRGWDVVCYGMI